MNGVAKNQEELLGLKKTKRKKQKTSPPSLSAGASGKPRVNSDHKPGHSEPWGPVQPGGFCEQETTSPPALE